MRDIFLELSAAQIDFIFERRLICADAYIREAIPLFTDPDIL